MDLTHEQALQPDQRRSRRAEAVFKPVALPAVAAAVCVVRQQPSPTPPRELPPFLRKDAVID